MDTYLNLVNSINVRRNVLYQRIIKGLNDVVIHLYNNTHTIKTFFTTQLFIFKYQII